MKRELAIKALSRMTCRALLNITHRFSPRSSGENLSHSTSGVT